MLLWHSGATIAIARYVFRDDRMDLRMLLAGGLLADIVDTPIGLALYGRLGGVRLAAHGLLVATAVMVGVVLRTRRGRPRKQWMPLAIGMLLHLLLDAVWLNPETLWWPVLGWQFSPAGPVSVGGYLTAVLTDWKTWLTEAAGLAYLVYLWSAAGLADPGRRRIFFTTGRIGVAVDGDVSC